MDYLKNHVFSRKSGVRHLAALLLTFFVLALTYLIMALGLGDSGWFHEFYEDMNRADDMPVFWGAVGTGLGMAALMGGMLRRCGESWIVRFFQKFFYSVIGAVPIVNLLVPLIYQHARKKQGKGEFVSDGSFRDSLKAETYRALVTNNTVLHPNGKMKFGIIRFAFVATFRLIGGVFALFFALLVPALTPLGVGLGVMVLAVVSEYSAEAAFWIGAAAAGLTVLIDVLHPMIALLIHPRRTAPAPVVVQPEPDAYAYEPLPDSEPASEPEEEDSGVELVDPVEENDHEPESIPDPEEVPQPPVEDSSDPLGRIGDRKDLIEVTERGPAREIENRKEKEL